MLHIIYVSCVEDGNQGLQTFAECPLIVFLDTALSHEAWVRREFADRFPLQRSFKEGLEVPTSSF